MQTMSSKKDELLMHASELFDGQIQPKQQGEVNQFDLFASDEIQKHATNWALIGSALRNELPRKVDLNFTSSVMANIRGQVSTNNIEATPDSFELKEQVFCTQRKVMPLPSNLRKNNTFACNVMNVVRKEKSESCANKQVANDVDTSKEQTTTAVSKYFSFKRLSLYVAQISIAASVAAITVIGLQTYNISEPVLEQPASTAFTNNSAIGGVNLASYQNKDNEVNLNVGQAFRSFESSNDDNSNDYQAEMKRQQKEEIDKINRYVQGYVLDTASR